MLVWVWNCWNSLVVMLLDKHTSGSYIQYATQVEWISSASTETRYSQHWSVTSGKFFIQFHLVGLQYHHVHACLPIRLPYQLNFNRFIVHCYHHGVYPLQCLCPHTHTHTPMWIRLSVSTINLCNTKAYFLGLLNIICAIQQNSCQHCL